MKTLSLQKQTISTLKAQIVNGGAPTTHSMVTMDKGCISQQGCEPIPPQQPDTTNLSYSNCGECGGSWLNC